MSHRCYLCGQIAGKKNRQSSGKLLDKTEMPKRKEHFVLFVAGQKVREFVETGEDANLICRAFRAEKGVETSMISPKTQIRYR